MSKNRANYEKLLVEDLSQLTDDLFVLFMYTNEGKHTDTLILTVLEPILVSATHRVSAGRPGLTITCPWIFLTAGANGSHIAFFLCFFENINQGLLVFSRERCKEIQHVSLMSTNGLLGLVRRAVIITYFS